MPRCGIVILAAGGSRRLGSAKQLVRVDGVSLLNRIASQAVASECRPVVIVLGAQAETLRPELEGLPVTVTLNEQWQSGIGSSIRRGVASLIALDPTVDAVLIAMCDQPQITSAIFDRLVAARASSRKTVCAAEYAGTIGTPAVFASSLFSELLALSDTTGGRAVILQHLDSVDRLPVPEAEMDLDTPEDLNRYSGGNLPKD